MDIAPKKFSTGMLTVTDEVVEQMENEEFRTFVYASYIRYCNCDWGDIERSDQKINKQNLKHGGNLGGRYIDPEKGFEIWILTDEYRLKTVISLPEKKSKIGTENVEQ